MKLYEAMSMLNLASGGSRRGRGEVALESPVAVVPCRRRHGRRSRATFFVRCSKDLLETLVLIPGGLYVDDTLSDLRRNLTVKIYPRTGQPCRRDLDGQDI